MPTKVFSYFYIQIDKTYWTCSIISMIIHNPFILEFTVKNSTFFCLRDEKLWHSNFLIWLLSYESVVYWTLKSDIYMNFSVQREPCKIYQYFWDWIMCIIVPIWMVGRNRLRIHEGKQEYYEIILNVRLLSM